MLEENFDIVEKLGTHNNFKEQRNTKAYKLLVENKVDTNEYLNIDKENGAGTYPVKEKDTEIQKANEESFLNDLLEFGNTIAQSDVGKSVGSRFQEGWINIADFGTNIFNTFDKLFSLDPNYERSEIFTNFSNNLEKIRNTLQEQREEIEGKKSDWVGMIVQDMPAYFIIDSILKKAGIKKLNHRMPLAIGISYAMSFDVEGEKATHYVPSEWITKLKHTLGVLPDTPEDQLTDDFFQLAEAYGAAWIFQGVVPALKFIKRNTKPQAVTDLAKGAAATGVLAKSAYDTLNPNEQVEIPPIDPNKPIIDVSDPKLLEMGMIPSIEKLLSTKAGEVIPSLKKFGSELFKKKTISRFSKQAEEGEFGKNWYKQSGENILKYVGGDKKAADQFAQILAIYSPQKEIPHNTLFAIKAWNRFKSGQKIWEGEILEKAKLPKNLNTTQENKFKKDLLAKYGGGARVKGEKFTGVELVDLEDGNLMVVRHGTYENIAERAKDLKAHLLLNENIPWGGRKTNSFYGNIMKEIDPSIKQAATIDMWMNRAGGFVSKELKDGPKYNFIESVVDTVAKKKKWDIDQAQAAIWVSTKARFNATKSLFSEKALKSGVGVRKGGHVVPAKGKNKEFADLRFNTAMNYKIASQDIEKAAINFADALDDNLAFVSWETVPGKYTKHLDGLEKASSQIKSEYHFKVSNLLTDDVGQDVLAKKLGILSPGHFEGPGYYKGVSSPASHTKIATTRIKGAGKDVTTMDAPSQTLLEKYAALRGVILSQNEIGYHRIIRAGSRKNANAAAVQVNNELTAEQFRKFGLALDKTFGVGNHAFISKEKGVLVLNTSKLNNTEFQKRLEKLVEIAIESKAQIIYYKNGNLISREATDYGKNYSDILGQIRRTDIRQLVRDLLTKKKNLDKEFSEKYGFRYEEKAFEEIESFIQRR